MINADKNWALQAFWSREPEFHDVWNLILLLLCTHFYISWQPKWEFQMYFILFQIGFVGVRGNEYSGDIALDNVRVRAGSC